MESLLAGLAISMTELKENPSAVLEQSDGETVVILNHDKPAAYLVAAGTYEALMNRLEDFELARIIQEREKEVSQAIAVDLDDL